MSPREVAVLVAVVSTITFIIGAYVGHSSAMNMVRSWEGTRLETKHLGAGTCLYEDGALVACQGNVLGLQGSGE